tara:strand:+ start:197 stop:490 length:294 start_codon:yes stop_codon:yes gene_type:complete
LDDKSRTNQKSQHKTYKSTRCHRREDEKNVMTGAPRKMMEASHAQLGQCAKAQGKRVGEVEALRNGIGTYTDGEIRPCSKKQGIKCLKNEKQEAQTH